MSLTIKIDDGGLVSALQQLDAKTQQVFVRPAAQAGAQVFVDQVRRNVQTIGRKTGNLINAIYQAYSKEHSGLGKAVYHVSWNARKAPHAHLVEWGHTRYFKQYIGKDGNWYTRVRPEALGYKVFRLKSGEYRSRRAKGPDGKYLPRMDRPSNSASIAEKMKYYEPLPAPVRVPAKPFIRAAYYTVKDRAAEAMINRLYQDLYAAWGA